jgi:hypothetical protein
VSHDIGGKAKSDVEREATDTLSDDHQKEQFVDVSGQNTHNNTQVLQLSGSETAPEKGEREIKVTENNGLAANECLTEDRVNSESPNTNDQNTVNTQSLELSELDNVPDQSTFETNATADSFRAATDSLVEDSFMGELSSASDQNSVSKESAEPPRPETTLEKTAFDSSKDENSEYIDIRDNKSPESEEAKESPIYTDHDSGNKPEPVDQNNESSSPHSGHGDASCPQGQTDNNKDNNWAEKGQGNNGVEKDQDSNEVENDEDNNGVEKDQGSNRAEDIYLADGKEGHDVDRLSADASVSTDTSLALTQSTCLGDSSVQQQPTAQSSTNASEEVAINVNSEHDMANDTVVQDEATVGQREEAEEEKANWNTRPSAVVSREISCSEAGERVVEGCQGVRNLLNLAVT